MGTDVAELGLCAGAQLISLALRQLADRISGIANHKFPLLTSAIRSERRNVSVTPIKQAMIFFYKKISHFLYSLLPPVNGKINIFG